MIKETRLRKSFIEINNERRRRITSDLNELKMMCENGIVFTLRIQNTMRSIKRKLLNEENYSAKDDAAIPWYN